MLGAIGERTHYLAEQHCEAAILKERARMARDLHNTLAQGFTGVIMQMEAAEEALLEATQSSRTELQKFLTNHVAIRLKPEQRAMENCANWLLPTRGRSPEFRHHVF